MASQFVVDNEGVGATGLLTMKVDASSGKDFTQADLDTGRAACVVSDNNEGGMGRIRRNAVGDYYPGLLHRASSRSGAVKIQYRRNSGNQSNGRSRWGGKSENRYR